MRLRNKRAGEFYTFSKTIFCNNKKKRKKTEKERAKSKELRNQRLNVLSWLVAINGNKMSTHVEQIIIKQEKFYEKGERK